MNAKIGTAILAVVCLGLVVALAVFKRQADTQQAANASTISDFSNQIVSANNHIVDLGQVNLSLSNDLTATREISAALSNRVAETASDLAAATASLQGAQQQITNLNDRIAELEAQNQVLDQRASSLSNTMAELDTQITLTKMKLATSQTNNAFLDAELKRQIAQRAELERKFNDLAEVRAQVHKLRMDMLVARRLEWMREGIDPTKPMKGAQLLMARSLPVPGLAAASSPLYNLNVEVGSDGSVRVIPPLTNAPATSPPAH